MNRLLLDQFQAFALPEVLEDSLEDGDAQCIAFNRWGTLLAAGLQDGRVVLWDFETRGVARHLPIHSAAVTSVAFSTDGRLLVASAADGRAKLWDVEKNEQDGEMNLGQHILHASMSRKDPRLCLVSFPSIAPSLIDFGEERSQTLPCLHVDLEKSGRSMGGSIQEGTTASFSKSGDLALLTLANGCIAVLQSPSLRFLDLIKIPGGTRAVNLALSPDGSHLIVNYFDRVIRCFEVCEGAAAGKRTYSLPELRKHLTSMQQVPSEGSMLYKEGALLRLVTTTFQNIVNRNPWQRAIFACDCEHVAAASAEKDVHNIHVWTRWGHLERILEGPKIGARDLAWHPTRSLLASVSTTGAVYLWARVQAENWSAFAPDFTELQENEEYVEPEDVFDVNPKQNGVPEGGGAPTPGRAHLGDIDILTEEEFRAESSDTEADLRGLRHLPADVIAQQFNGDGHLLVDGAPDAGNAVQPERGASPAPSSARDSEPAISDGGNSKQPSAEPDGRHRLASLSLPDDEPGFRLRPGRQRRYTEEVEDEELIAAEEAAEARRLKSYS